MIEQVRTTYLYTHWAKVVALVGLLLGGCLLFITSGGFPPWAWRFLVQTCVQLPRLWALQGAAVLVPFSGLVLLALALLVLWVILVILVFRVIKDWGRVPSVHDSFEMDLQEAERIAEAGLAASRRRYERKARDADFEGGKGPVGPVARHAPPSADRQAPPREQSYTGTYAAPARVNTSAPRPAAAPPLPLASSAPTGPLFRQPGAPRMNTVPLPARPPQPREQDAMVEPRAQQSLNLRQQLRLVPPPVDDEEWEHAPSGWQGERVTPPVRLPHPSDVDECETYPGRPLYEDEDYDGAVDIEDVEEDEEDISELETISGLPATADPDPVLVAEEVAPTPSPSLHLEVGIGLDPGIVRKHSPNEDSLFAIQGVRVTDEGPMPAGLFVIADGMGGHANGREASQQAVRTISDAVVPALLRDVSGKDIEDEDHVFLDMLKDGVHRANLAIYRRNRDLPDMMGTTLTSALVVNSTAYIVNVGDSRTYLYRASDGLMQITRDHSVVARLVESGNITREEIYTHPHRNQIYRCLGEHATVEVDTFVIPLQADDILLLCSDGLWEMVRDGALERIVATSAHQPAQIGTLLVQAALSQGGADNISVVVVGIVVSHE